MYETVAYLQILDGAGEVHTTGGRVIVSITLHIHTRMPYQTETTYTTDNWIRVSLPSPELYTETTVQSAWRNHFVINSSIFIIIVAPCSYDKTKWWNTLCPVHRSGVKPLSPQLVTYTQYTNTLVPTA